MKVAIISFQSNTDIIGAKYIHAYLQKNGQESYLIMQPHENGVTDDLIVEFIKEQRIDIVGVSLMSCEFYRARSFVKTLKRKKPSILVVFGGIHATIAPEECLSTADVVIRGEGECIFLDLIKCIEKNDDFTGLSGICIKKGDKILQNPAGILENDLDNFPFPGHLPNNMFVVEGKTIALMNINLFREYSRHRGIFPSITTTRGCPFSCSYCCNSVYRKLYKSHSIRKRTVKSVVSECVEIKEKHLYIMAFDFMDDCFLANDIDWIREFSKQYKARIGLPFFIRTIPKYLTSEKMDMLKNAGLAWIFMGLQSGSDRVNKEIFKRNISSQEFLNAANMVSDSGVCGFYDIILDNPYETDKDKLDTLKVGLNIPGAFQLQFFSLCFYQGTELAAKAASDNIPYEDPRSKLYKMPESSLHNSLVRMIPTYPFAVIEFLSRYREYKIIQMLIKLSDMFNRLFLEPVSYLRLMHLSFGSDIFKTIKLVSCYKAMLLRKQKLKSN